MTASLNCLPLVPPRVDVEAVEAIEVVDEEGPSDTDADADDFAAQLDDRGVARFETVIPASIPIGRLRGTVPNPGKFRFDDLTTELLEVL